MFYSFADIVHLTINTVNLYDTFIFNSNELQEHYMITNIRKHSNGQPTTEVVEHIASILQGIRFGSVEIVIHDGKIVQIERREKLRFDAK
jgi:hypothetical protein